VPETVRFKYRAFLSYSHPDTGSANVTGLQAELEAAFRKLPIAPPDKASSASSVTPLMGNRRQPQRAGEGVIGIILA